MKSADTKILIVDDEDDFREIFSSLILRMGYKSYTAANGLEALEKVKTIQPDIAIVDYQMPRMNGVELAKAIRKQNIGTAILFITGYEMPPAIAEICALGAFDYITKPLDFRKIEKQIRCIVEKR